MKITIPFSVENEPTDCSIDLRDLSDGYTIFEVFRGRCEPGIHSVEFDPGSVPNGLEAGLYLLHVKIGNNHYRYPVQYMP